MPMDASDVANLLRDLPCFAGRELCVTSCSETEWHQIYMVDDGDTKVVASIPSWQGLASW